MRGRVKGRDIIMLIGGGYLCYLGVQTIVTGIVGGQMSQKWRWLGLICAIAFVVFGAGEVILCIRRIFMSTKNEQTEEELEGAEKAVAVEELTEAERQENEQRARSIQDLIAENSVEDEEIRETEDPE